MYMHVCVYVCVCVRVYVHRLHKPLHLRVLHFVYVAKNSERERVCVCGGVGGL